MENNETHVFLKQNYYFPNGSLSTIAFFDYRFTRMSSMVFHDISIHNPFIIIYTNGGFIIYIVMDPMLMNI